MLLKIARGAVISPIYQKTAEVTLYEGDRLDLLRQIELSGDRAQLIITSPPYNIGKEYETQMRLDEYVESQRQTIEACVRVLSETGSICWQVGHYIEGTGKNKEAFPLDIVLYPIDSTQNKVSWDACSAMRPSRRNQKIYWL